MSLNLEVLAEALKVPVGFTDKDREDILEMRKKGMSVWSAKDEVLASKILVRIAELVEKVEKLDWYLQIL